MPYRTSRTAGDFNLKAFDKTNINRTFDTEMKYVFNFVEEHWDKGNLFKITMESVLYSCTSCQRYLLSLQKYAKSQGKIIEIEFVSFEKATSMPTLNKILKP